MKQSQADLYLETYQVLDLEMSRLREIQRWQASAASKLAADMQRFSRPERRINGPTVTHLWSMLKLLDVLIQLDHLKNAKASIPNDFSWYKRTFTQVSVQWQDTDSMREELDDLQIFLSTRWAILLNLHVEMFRVNNVEDILQILIVFIVESLELNFALLFPERHTLLRVLPVLVVLASSSEKDSESLYKRVKINRLINIFKNDPVIPAFPDLHLSPAAILKELSTYFPKFSAQTRALTLPAPHELQPREAQEYQRQYLIVNHIGAIRAEHDDFTVRFASAMSQLVLLKSIDGVDVEWVKEVKGNIYDMVVEGFQLLSRWTARVWEQCAWKFSRPCKDPVPIESQEMPASFSDYEKVVRYNYSAEERKALVELVSYIKSIGSMMQKVDTSVTDALWETIHAEVQDFVQNTVATMLRTTFRKKKDLSRILSDMRTLSADWMANTSKPETEMQSYQHSGEESRGTFFFPRPVAPTSAQVHCLQFLIYEVVSGGNMRKPGGIFGNSGSEIPINDLKQLETFFYKLGFFLHVLDYTATLGTLTDLGFLWFREFYLESSRVIQFPIECSLPWMLVDHVIESPIIGLLESALMPFDIYNDAAQQALVILKQRFLYDEIEAEVDNCFDIFVLKLCETIFTYYKSWAARELLDPSFLFAIDIGEKFAVQPMRFIALLKTTRVKLLGRTINLRSLIADRMNKMFRDNLEFLFDRFESQDLCAIVELEMLLDILQLTHELLSKDLIIDSFNLMLNEMQENVSLVSYSSRLASQIWTEMQNDFLPNFILCNTTQRFVRSSRVPPVPVQKPSVPYAKPNFYCGTPDLNSAYQSFARLYCGFFGVPHMFSLVKLVGSRSLPWLMRALLDHISNKITTVEPMITGLQQALPKSIGLLPFDGGISGCMRLVKEHLSCWHSKSELKAEVLCGIKEIGSILYWMGLLDIVLCNKIEKTELKEMMEETEQRTQKQSKEIKKKEERRRKRKKKNSNGGRPEEEESRRRRKEKKETYLVKKGSLMADDGRRRRCEPNPYFVAEEELEKKGSLLREVDTRHFMQTAPWLGLIPGADGQILHSQDGGDSPMVTLFKSATTATVSNHNCTNPTSFHTISRQAEAADLLYKANINTGSVLEYALAFTSAALDKYCSKWSAAPKTGFIDITTSKDFYRIFSGLQIEYLEESVQLQSNTYEMLGDSVAWGGCTIIYLLGQQLHFELFDFSHQVLNVAEVESVAISPTQKNPNFLQGIEGLLEAMKKARRLNNHVFSMLKARCPLEDKQACAIKQSGAPLHRVKFENTVSAFETLPQKGA
nr:PREDICTED: protein PIR isoform X2 [Nicotiana sylvestris]